MAGTTPRYDFPYQSPGDPPDGASLGEDLAEAVESSLGTVEDAADTRMDAIEAATTGKPIVRLVQASTQSLTSGSAVALAFSGASELIDTHNFHNPSSNDSRITPTVAGYYRLSASLSMQSGTFTQLLVGFRKNGTNQPTVRVARPDAASAAAQSVSAQSIVLTANGSTDYFEVIVQQNSAGAVSTSIAAGFASTFECVFERPL